MDSHWGQELDGQGGEIKGDERAGRRSLGSRESWRAWGHQGPGQGQEWLLGKPWAPEIMGGPGAHWDRGTEATAEGALSH